MKETMKSRLTIFIFAFTFFATGISAQTLVEDDQGRIQIKQESTLEVTPLQQMLSSKQITSFETRSAIGEIWERTAWDDPQMNFSPGGTFVPAGDLTGDGNIDFFRTYFNVSDDRDPSGETFTSKTLVFFGDDPGTDYDLIVYRALMPAGDINKDGKSNLLGLNPDTGEWEIFLFDGTAYTTEPLGVAYMNDFITHKTEVIFGHDINNSGAEDLIFNQGYNIYVLFGGESGERDIMAQNILTLKPDEFPEASAMAPVLKDFFEHNGSWHLAMRSPLNWSFTDRIALFAVFNSDDNLFELADHMVFDPGQRLGNNGLLRAVTLNEGDTLKHLMWSYPLTGSTIIYPPSEVEGEIFSRNAITLHDSFMRPMGDLTGNGYDLFAGFIGAVPHILASETDPADGIRVMTPISDDTLFVPQLGSPGPILPRYYGYASGNGRDDYYLIVNSEDSFGQIRVSGAPDNTFTSSLYLYSREDFSRRVAHDIFGLGDITGNGFDDFLVYYINGFLDNEMAFHEGGAGWQTPAKTWQLQPGQDVQSALGGNFTDQNRRDLVIFTNLFDPTVNFRSGEVWMFEGGGIPADDPFWKIDGETFRPGSQISGLIGTIANAGDINNSGYHDLLVGAPFQGDADGSIPVGVYFGRQDLPQSSPDAWIDFDNPGGFGIGSIIQSVGDVNGDGIDDFIVGNMQEGWQEDFMNYGQQGGGRIHVFFGREAIVGGPDFSSPAFTLAPDTLSLLDGNQMTYFAFSEVGFGDFNGSGHTDLATIPFWFRNAANLQEGRPGLHVFHGDNFSGQPDQLIGLKHDLFNPLWPMDYTYTAFMGRTPIAGVPDITGNGADELLIIGSSGQTNAFLFFGGESLGETDGILFEAPNQSLTMGSPGNFINRQYRAAIGDFNGDGSLNFLTVQRGEMRFQDTPVYLFELGETATSSELVSTLPDAFMLEQNYPNPFNPTTVIRYQLPVQSDVRIEVFDILGRRVATLVNETMEAGTHQVTFDGSRLASGIYHYRLTAGDFAQTRRFTLIK